MVNEKWGVISLLYGTAMESDRMLHHFSKLYIQSEFAKVTVRFLYNAIYPNLFFWWSWFVFINYKHDLTHLGTFVDKRDSLYWYPTLKVIGAIVRLSWKQ